MNTLRIPVSVTSLSQLNQVGFNTYQLWVHFLDGGGIPIVNSNLPATPYVATIVTTSPSFDINIPITQATYNIDDVVIKVFGNTNNNECCNNSKEYDIHNVNSVPAFDYQYFPPICNSDSTYTPARFELTNIVNGTRYKACYNELDFGNCGDCTSSTGTISGSSATITLSTPTIPTSRFVILRVYNGSGCTMYRQISETITTPLCCPPDGTWSQNSNNRWYKMLTASSTASPSGYAIVSKQSEFYAIDGTRIFSTDYSTYTTLSSIPLWKANTATNGPMNRCSVWTNKDDGDFPVNFLPLNMWLGFTHCLTGLTPGKRYYVGIEADNTFRLRVDNQVIYENLGADTHFRTWKIIPVVATRSEMVISMEAKNNERVAGFGCEIYDNTEAEITAATVIGDLNIIFTSASKIGGFFQIGGLSGGIQYGYGCPNGYDFNDCNGLCTTFLYCD